MLAGIPLQDQEIKGDPWTEHIEVAILISVLAKEW